MYLQSGQTDKAESALCDRARTRQKRSTSRLWYPRRRVRPEAWDTASEVLRGLVPVEDDANYCRALIVYSFVFIVMPGCVCVLMGGVLFFLVSGLAGR